MKLSSREPLLSSLLKPVSKPPTPCPAAIAEANRRAALIALAHWGHLRTAELAAAVWPEAKYREQLAQRMLKQLSADGLAIERANSLGSRSFVLTRPGAAAVQSIGFDARHGLDLSSVTGPTFLHRSIATNFGIHAQQSGFRCYGEHAMLYPNAPLSRDLLRKALGKIPDAYVIEGTFVDLVEVESAAKPAGEIQKCIRTLLFSGRTFRDTNYVLRRLVFVCDSRQNHKRRIQGILGTLDESLVATLKRHPTGLLQYVPVAVGPKGKVLEIGRRERLI